VPRGVMRLDESVPIRHERDVRAWRTTTARERSWPYGSGGTSCRVAYSHRGSMKTTVAVGDRARQQPRKPVGSAPWTP
jgi:hypothetical protein